MWTLFGLVMCVCVCVCLEENIWTWQECRSENLPQQTKSPLSFTPLYVFIRGCEGPSARSLPPGSLSLSPSLCFQPAFWADMLETSTSYNNDWLWNCMRYTSKHSCQLKFIHNYNVNIKNGTLWFCDLFWDLIVKGDHNYSTFSFVWQNSTSEMQF